jgi:uncharacterized alpha/beta hydrolase family protein
MIALIIFLAAVIIVGVVKNAFFETKYEVDKEDDSSSK